MQIGRGRRHAVGIFLALVLLWVVLTAALSGRFGGGEWYQTMRQPPWNPPPAFMAFAWSMYYLALALAAWLLWQRCRRRAARRLLAWSLLSLPNVLWAWFFFGMHRIGWSLAVAGLWLTAVLAAAWRIRREVPAAAGLLLLTGAWLGFVIALNFSQWLLNGGGL